MNTSRKNAIRTLGLAAVLSFVSISPAAAVSSGSFEKQVITRTNQHRANHDRVAVKAQSCVDRWAENQARWMAKHGKLEHRKGRLADVLDDCKLTGVSENIAYGYSSGKKTTDAWMRSTGHRRNILTSKMRYVGVGAVKDDDGVWWVAQVFGTKK